MLLPDIVASILACRLPHNHLMMMDSRVDPPREDAARLLVVIERRTGVTVHQGTLQTAGAFLAALSIGEARGYDVLVPQTDGLPNSTES